MFVVFATPCLSSKIELDYFYSYLFSSELLRKAGIDHTIVCQGGIAFIDHARNILCHKFLHDHPQATDLFFIDDDVGWYPEAVVQLLGHKEGVVGGVYPLKQDQIGFPVSLEADPDTHQFIEQNGLIEATFLPTGFMRIRRKVIEMMAADQPTYPHRRADGVTEHIKNIFHTGYYDGERWGEDVDFANRWRAMGGRMWVDPEIVLSHTGRKRWTASFKDAVTAGRARLVEHYKEVENGKEAEG
jgi:hypothetical protein